ncbi:MAG: NAD-dependent epimerase/dehydratase family protein [Halobacteriaceae archaeon]
MTVLVTGAPGWLGSTLVDRLDDRDEDVRCLVYEGLDPAALDDYDVETVTGDVTDADSLDDAFAGGVDTVFHCAGVNHPGFRGGVSAIHAINAGGTRNMLEAGRRHGVGHFVYVSSIVAEGFSEGPDHLLDEDDPMRPRTEYGKAKLEAEEHIHDYREAYDIPYTVLRPCWYYGPEQPDRMATLMQSIDSGRPIMFGNGRNRRSMTYVPALVDLMEAVMDTPSVSQDESYVVADQEPYTTNEIYETIARHLGVDISPLRFREPFPTVAKYVQRTLERVDCHSQNFHVAWEMSRHIAADPSKAMRDLDWEPPAALDPGMETAVEWARAHGQV